MGPIFLGVEGGRTDRYCADRMVKRLVKRAGIDKRAANRTACVTRSSPPFQQSHCATSKKPQRTPTPARRCVTIVTRHHGFSVAIFGSVARGEERPDSDIDFLVELAPHTRPIEILSIGVELEEALGVKVDVGTPTSLREALRDEVLAEAVPL